MKLNIQLFADGSVTIPVDLDTKSFDRQIAKLEYKLEDLEETYKLALKDPDFGEKKLIDLQQEIETTRNKIIGLQKQQLALNQTTKENSSSFSNIGKKLTKMGLAVFGIRSAFMLIRQSMSQIAQENDNVANKLNTIKSSLANAIAPIAEGLVNVVYKLLAYLNVITKTFLGLDLFKKSAKSSKQTLGNAKKLSKTLTKFDEMEILNDNTQSAGGGGTAGGIKIEEPDVSGFQKVVDKYKQMWDDILKIDRDEAKELFLQNGNTWGAFELLLFDFTQGTIKEFQGMFDTLKGLWDIVVGWANDDDERIKKGQEKLKSGLLLIWDGFKQKIQGIIEFPYNFGQTIGTKLRNWINDKLVKPIIDTIDTIKKKLKDTFKEGFWKTILNYFIDIFNKAIGKINDKLTISIGSTLSKVLKALGVNVSSGKYSLFTIPKIPKLARGGIINMPSRGIPIGNAIAGERGAEGVIPLTDSQQMELLGQAIGKYITINATIPVYAYNRQVDRQMRKIQAEDSFASNR